MKSFHILKMVLKNQQNRQFLSFKIIFWKRLSTKSGVWYIIRKKKLFTNQLFKAIEDLPVEYIFMGGQLFFENPHLSSFFGHFLTINSIWEEIGWSKVMLLYIWSKVVHWYNQNCKLFEVNYIASNYIGGTK